MYNNNGGQGGAWVPGMGMPPLGFGVVAQQPGGSRMMGAGQQVAAQAQHMTNWHQQQFMAAQMGIPGAAVGIQHMPHHHQQQQQPGFQQYQQPAQLFQQQQWVEAQKKAAEEQKKFYDQIMKQRQFVEQKMRLKAFSNTKKGGVSADSMIENILRTKDTQKPKSPPVPKKVASSEAAASVSAANAKQGTAVDWSKMNHIDTLFATPKFTTSTSGVNIASENQSSDPALDPTVTGVKPSSVNSGLPSGHQPRPPFKSTNVGVTGVGTVAPGGGGSAVNKKPPGKPIALPSWLSDKSNVPAIYKHAGSLVEGKDGWVDTSRAYMLLMKTGLPAPFLGVLWEMVNRTQPGQLTDQEFTTLLALVALVQTGQAITSPDVLSGTNEPVLPIIDHPALLPLVQDYIQHRQQIQQQQLQEQHQQQEQQQQLQQSSNVENNLSIANFGAENQQETKNNDDEFEDFVSGPTSMSGPSSMSDPISVSDPMSNSGTVYVSGTMTNIFEPTTGSVATTFNITGSVHPSTQHALLGSSQVNHKPLLPCVDKVKRMNLPEVGFSPELSPSTSFDHAHDDDFDDFQSAAMTSVPASSSSSLFMGPTQTSQFQSTVPGTEIPHNSDILPLESVNDSNSSQDKYAVFRELETPGDDSSVGNSNSLALDVGNSGDDSFGDFCSSEPVSLTITPSNFPPIMSSNTAGSGTSNTTPVSFEVFSTPPEVPESSLDAQFEADFGVFNSASSQPPNNYADIHEAMKRVEAEQKQNIANNWNDPFGEFEESHSLQTASQSIPQLSVASGVDDDDFGDFMGPDGGLPEQDSLSFNHQFPRLLEGLGETQSVASLELPGLEMTVGLQASESRGSGSGQSPDIFMQARSEVCGVEDQLRGLTLDPPLTLPELPSQNGGGVILPSANGSSNVTQSTGTNPVLDSFSGGLMDKYSIIREEATKNTYDEAHTGSWQRCLEGSVKLLEQGHNTLSNLADKKLKSEVLTTSQMHDYLANLQEVWYVCERISNSSQRVTTSIKVDQLLSQAKTLWEEILTDSDNTLTKQVEMPEGENQMNESEVCGVCLAGGGSKLTYGGHSYHPPCANLWLNCVDLLLPSLTPVTLL